MDFAEQLALLGLNGRQGKIYLTLLQFGSASAIELAKHTGFKHPTVYDVLELLKNKGLVSETFSDGRKLFSAESPENLQVFESRRQHVLDEIFPSLWELYLGRNRQPKIRFYEGHEAQLKVDEELLNIKTGEYFYFGSVQEILKRNTREYLEEFYQRRTARGIWSNAIRTPPPKTMLDCMQSGERHLRRVRYLPTPIREDIAELYIYDGKIAILSTWKENYSMILESHDLFLLLKTIWQCLWAVAQETPAENENNRLE